MLDAKEENSVINNEKFYVYHLIDPRDKSVFYVGKGCGDRVDQHEKDARNLKFSNSEKEQRIHDIWHSGKQVEKVFVKFFSDEKSAYSFESEQIDVFGIENLTNVSGGRQSEHLKAFRRGQAFIAQIKKLIPHLSAESKIIAEGLVEEMLENIAACKKYLGEDYASA